MTLGNNIQNSGLDAILQKAPQQVISAIKSASAKTGVDFAYLVQQAGAESGFKSTAKAKTSSASGLYQFIESTWLSMVDKYGEKHGIETDGKTRGQLLALRNDPQKAAVMAAEFASENERSLRANYKGDVGATELYFAHFLGAGQASAFLNARAENPMQPAADIFPAAAKANKNVFYDRTTGRAKSLDEVYAFFDKKFSVKDSSAESTTHANAGMPADMTAQNPLSSVIFTDIKEQNRAVGIDDLYAMISDSTEATLWGQDKDSASSVALNTFSHHNAQKYKTTSLKADSSARAARPFGSLGTFVNLVTNPIEIMIMAKLDMPVKNASDKS